MRHAPLPDRAPGRITARRPLAFHRPPPPTGSRVRPDRGNLRGSDIVLVLLGLTLLGALCLIAAVDLLGRALAP